MWDEFFEHFKEGRKTLTPLSSKAKELVAEQGYPTFKLFFRNKKEMLKTRNYFYFAFVKKYSKNWW